ncbi:hypothetical protein KKE60_07825 [Patescibacteria group bacterium]|nr:hypothetical protein [Patescibacteria group bacterium]
MKEDKWIHRWIVESESGHGSYTVGQDAGGNWGCSCPAWTRHVPRRDCKHITTVRMGGGRTLTEAIVDRMKGGEDPYAVPDAQRLIRRLKRM